MRVFVIRPSIGVSTITAIAITAEHWTNKLVAIKFATINKITVVITITEFVIIADS